MIYDDFMGLSDLRINNWRAIVFSGIGGSGKSTAMQYLLQIFPEIEKSGVCWITGSPLDWSRYRQYQWLFVDEVVFLKDALKVRKLVNLGYQVVIATHLPLWCLRIVFAGIATRFYSADEFSDKLSSFMNREGINYTDSSLREYISLYGQSYDTLSLILEHSGQADLTTALNNFRQHCRLAISRH